MKIIYLVIYYIYIYISVSLLLLPNQLLNSMSACTTMGILTIFPSTLSILLPLFAPPLASPLWSFTWLSHAFVPSSSSFVLSSTLQISMFSSRWIRGTNSFAVQAAAVCGIDKGAPFPPSLDLQMLNLPFFPLTCCNFDFMFSLWYSHCSSIKFKFSLCSPTLACCRCIFVEFFDFADGAYKKYREDRCRTLIGLLNCASYLFWCIFNIELAYRY